ncbi:cytochrome c [Guyparkeria hydrothermalis]|uniref:c-type cytochrome n=1 Tax=Guyparkeria hydrothermalis TaxID=923 RepID=UPI00202049D5|nr:cytochrome c [Guyparkeria hydrothermalis]MCL7743753.1 cytochrome c [Guyparkeria hydrothermalis]
MSKKRRIESIAGVRDESFIPYETYKRIPWPVYSVVIALAAWGAFTLFNVDSDAPAVANTPTSEQTASREAGSGAASPGQAVFNANCATCHQEDGIGLSGAVPPLAGSSFVTGQADVTASIVLMGVSGQLVVKGETYNGRMPTFRKTLSDTEIAAVVTYIRQAWGNDAEPITASKVAKVRKRLADDTAPLDGNRGIAALLTADRSSSTGSSSDARATSTTR